MTGGIPWLGRSLAASILLGLATTAAAACTASSQAVSFGAYDTRSLEPLDGVGTVSVNCDTSTSFTVALSSGSGTAERRQMTSGASQLDYNFYTDATRTVIWGDGVSGTTVSATGTAVDLTVYGRIPPQQNVTAGAYSDRVVVTISY